MYTVCTLNQFKRVGLSYMELSDLSSDTNKVYKFPLFYNR